MAETEVVTYETAKEWTIRGKGIMEEAKTLEEAADMIQEFAEFVRQMSKDGWKLDGPVEDDYGFCSRKKIKNKK